MIIPTKKLKSGLELPVYGLGLWEMGGRLETDKSKDSIEVKALQAALDLGVTHFDAAESYGNGHAEELLAEAVKGYDRKKLFIATKVSANHQSYEGVLKSFEASLKRLNMDYVDLYMLHRYPEVGLPIAGAMRALDELVKRGLVKNIGVSNLSVNRFIEAQKHTKNKIVCNQVHYNVKYREMEHKGVLKYCQDNDVFLVAWRPLQKGELLESPFMSKIAKKYGKTPAQVALKWLISQDNVIVLSKTSSIEHLKENLGSVDWTMEPEDVELIKKEFPDQKIESDRVPLDYPADTPA